MREDNLGLGAKIGKGNAETFGLSLFSGVLGRLNGKSDVEVQKQQSALRDAELRTYQAQKYGLMNFVSGGVLVGDMIQPATEETIGASKKRSHTSMLDKEEQRAQKRRRRKEAKQQLTSSTDSSTTISRATSDVAQEDEANPNPLAKIKEREKRSKMKHRNIESKTTDQVEDAVSTATEDERLRLKQEKRDRKEDRRKRKEEKKRSKAKPSSPEPESFQSHKEEGSTVLPAREQESVAFQGNRHVLRQRYIQQKRMASMDPQAMKEIFMLKAAG